MGRPRPPRLHPPPVRRSTAKRCSRRPAAGATPTAGALAGKGPKLAASQRSDEFIVQRIKHGKEGAMPAFDNTYNDQQIAEIIKYLRSLKDDAG